MTAARRLTATAIANECIPASASTTFELMKPPYDFVPFPASNHVPCRYQNGKATYPTPDTYPFRVDVILRCPITVCGGGGGRKQKPRKNVQASTKKKIRIKTRD